MGSIYKYIKLLQFYLKPIRQPPKFAYLLMSAQLWWRWWYERQLSFFINY